jgi:hypothetical protein
MLKRLAALAKKIKEIMELLGNRVSTVNEDDAMLSKRHLGPSACASCDKNLINL